MSSPLHVQYALMCLQELDRQEEDFLDVQEISHKGGIPQQECRDILRRLHAAGIIEAKDGQMFALRQPLASLTVMQVVQAIWTTETKKAPAFRMLTVPSQGALRKTLEAVGSISSDAGMWN